jgi:hypothetical protein
VAPFEGPPVAVLSLVQALDGSVTVTFSSSVSGIGGATSNRISDTTQAAVMTWIADFSGTAGVLVTQSIQMVGDTYQVSAGSDLSLVGVALSASTGAVDGTVLPFESIDSTPEINFSGPVTSVTNSGVEPLITVGVGEGNFNINQSGPGVSFAANTDVGMSVGDAIVITPGPSVCFIGGVWPAFNGVVAP